MVTATAWVPRGYAAQFPSKYRFDEEEYERIAKLAKLELDDAKEDLDKATARANGTEPETAEAEEEADNDEDKDGDEDGDVYVSFTSAQSTMTDARQQRPSRRRPERI